MEQERQEQTEQHMGEFERINQYKDLVSLIRYARAMQGTPQGTGSFSCGSRGATMLRGLPRPIRPWTTWHNCA